MSNKYQRALAIGEEHGQTWYTPPTANDLYDLIAVDFFWDVAAETWVHVRSAALDADHLHRMASGGILRRRDGKWERTSQIDLEIAL